MSERIEYVINEIIDQYYLADNTYRPWIIGFSGGKDSTVLLQLVWEALRRIKNDLKAPLEREVYVVSNDTMVENPIITEYVDRVLEKIDHAAVAQDLPVKVRKTIPRLEDSFWVNMIGKGYPVPNNAFRWCTDRLKIKPTSRFLHEQIDFNGEAIILLGTRKAESATRAKSIKKHSKKGKRLNKHASNNNAFVYSPIKDLMLEEVWYIINAMESPWGADNSELFQIYSDASADDYECPTMVTSDKHKSCGQSRFGCWTCTVVQEDKSMSSLVDNGLEWLNPLLEYRNSLVDERNNIENRMPTRRNGQEASNGLGTYTPNYRAKKLKELLILQKEVQQEKPHVQLITNQELVAIQTIWYRDLIFDHKVSDIYNNVYQREFNMKNHDERKRKEEELLKKACKDDPMDFKVIQDALLLMKNKSLLTKKRGLKGDLEKLIEKAVNEEKK
jgi:DNA sulfur modification protein DndC